MARNEKPKQPNLGRLREAVRVGAEQAEQGQFISESVEEVVEEVKRERHGRRNANLPGKAR